MRHFPFCLWFLSVFLIAFTGKLKLLLECLLYHENSFFTGRTTVKGRALTHRPLLERQHWHLQRLGIERSLPQLLTLLPHELRLIQVRVVFDWPPAVIVSSLSHPVVCIPHSCHKEQLIKTAWRDQGVWNNNELWEIPKGRRENRGGAVDGRQSAMVLFCLVNLSMPDPVTPNCFS